MVQLLTARQKLKENNKNMKRNKSKMLLSGRTGAIILIVIILIVGGLWIKHDSGEKKAVSGTIPSSSTNTKSNQGGIASPSGTTSGTTTNSVKNPTGSTSTASGSLANPPSGTFVSNHKPNLSGSPAPSSEQSVCNTTPGATCYIEFKQGDIVKKLDSRVADSSGSVIWSWDVKQAGFTEGSWTISAVTSLNGRTKTTTDSLPLEVRP